MGYTRGMWEIELKIKISDPEQTAMQLDELGQRGGTYDKQDTYYQLKGDSSGQTAFRLRGEDGRYVVTHKVKAIQNGVEQSRETEFSISDPEAFGAFAEALGYTVAITKRKIGSWWQLEGLKAELSEVPPLGTWLELETLLEDSASERDIAAAKTKLETTVIKLGRSPAEAEERPYTQMLREAEGL